jgi:hypothetical protein
VSSVAGRSASGAGVRKTDRAMSGIIARRPRLPAAIAPAAGGPGCCEACGASCAPGAMPRRAGTALPQRHRGWRTP